MRVLYFGAYDQDYSRNRILIAGLRAAGVEVTECHAPLWRGTADKVAAAGSFRGAASSALRALRAYGALLRTYWPMRRGWDVMLLGYAGQIDVFPARVLSWLARRPLVLDVFMSVYLIALERGLKGQGALRLIEGLACRLPDRLLLDTSEYVAWFGRTYGLAPERFRLVPTGADDRVFRPQPPRPPDGLFRAVYYGSFIPNHGVGDIVEAARLLADDTSIRFELIGAGPDRAEAVARAEGYGLKNVAFVDWLQKDELLKRAAQADVCLGAFGKTPQSLMTIQNKIYEGLAMARPVISGDSPTVRAALTHGEHIYLVERGNPRSLADALLALKNDPALRARLAQGGHNLFLERYTIEAIGRRTRRHLEELLERRRTQRREGLW